MIKNPGYFEDLNPYKMAPIVSAAQKYAHTMLALAIFFFCMKSRNLLTLEKESLLYFSSTKICIVASFGNRRRLAWSCGRCRPTLRSTTSSSPTARTWPSSGRRTRGSWSASGSLPARRGYVRTRVRARQAARNSANREWIVNCNWQVYAYHMHF